MDILKAIIVMNSLLPIPLVVQRLISCTFLIIVMALTYTVEAQQCSWRPVQIVIRYNDCMPKRIIAGACTGTCTSYSRPSPDSPGDMEHFCQCCDVDEIAEPRVPLFCPRSRPSRVRIPIKIPRTCKCRPCSETPQNVLPSEAEQNIWEYRNKRIPRGSAKSEMQISQLIRYLLPIKKDLRLEEHFVKTNLTSNKT